MNAEIYHNTWIVVACLLVDYSVFYILVVFLMITVAKDLILFKI